MIRTAKKYQRGTLVEVPHPEDEVGKPSVLGRVEKIEELGIKDPIVHVRLLHNNAIWQYTGKEVKLFHDRRR
jgi:hypothetical protein